MMQAVFLSKKITSCFKFSIRDQFHWTYVAIVMIITSIPMGCGAHVYHVVERGETLYSIGWLYGYDYRSVAEWNQMEAPYVLKVGQRLRVVPLLNSSLKSQQAKRGKKPITEYEVRSKGPRSKTDKRDKYNRALKIPIKTDSHVNWLWPTKQGTIVNSFVGKDPGKRGLDIIGTEGQSIFSASSGKVVYSGNGLPRYGKLIIVKHNEVFLSAYAHNKELLVKEGDVVRSGQRIAVMGNSGTNGTKLHFEIRRFGKPVDPLRLLPKPVPKRIN